MRSYDPVEEGHLRNQYLVRRDQCRTQLARSVSVKVSQTLHVFGSQYCAYLGKVLVRVTVKFQLADVPDGDLLLGPDLGCVENVELKVVLLGLWDNLDTKVPLWIGLVLNGFPQILTVEVRILTGQLQSFIPDKTVDTQVRGEVELDKVAFTLGVHQSVCVDTKALHHSVRTGNGSIRLSPGEHVGGFCVEELEVPEVVVGSLSLRNLVVWFWLSSVNDIRELDSILDEEDGDVVSDNVPVALFCVELDCESTNITNSIGATTATKDCRETKEDWSGAGGVGQDTSRSDIFRAFKELEGAVCSSSSSVNYSFGNTFVIESVNLLTTGVVFEQGGASVVFTCHSKPIVRVRLLDTIVGSNSVVLVVVTDVFLVLYP